MRGRARRLCALRIRIQRGPRAAVILCGPQLDGELGVSWREPAELHVDAVSARPRRDEITVGREDDLRG